jgi:hypothetical protein
MKSYLNKTITIKKRRNMTMSSAEDNTSYVEESLQLQQQTVHSAINQQQHLPPTHTRPPRGTVLQQPSHPAQINNNNNAIMMGLPPSSSSISSNQYYYHQHHPPYYQYSAAVGIHNHQIPSSTTIYSASPPQQQQLNEAK